MSYIAVIAGESACGKSTSYCRYKNDKINIEGLNPEETFLILAGMDKMLPTVDAMKNYKELRKGDDGMVGNKFISNDYTKIKKILAYVQNNKKFKNLVIDDFQYLMAMDFFYRKDEAGFDKFGKIGFSVVDLVADLHKMRTSLDIFLLTHTSETGEGKEKKMTLKTIGRMLEEKFTFEGIFMPVLVAEKKWSPSKKRNEYFFYTTPHSQESIAKSPLGMFEEARIPNDLSIVKDALKNFKNLTNEL